MAIKRRTPLPRQRKPIARSPLKRSTKPIPKKRKTPRHYKTIVRLDAAGMEQLREDAHLRAHGRCEVPLPHDCPQFISLDYGDLAHIKSRGAGGSDTLDNVWWSCKTGHRVVMHTYGKDGLPPCPKKPRGDA